MFKCSNFTKIESGAWLYFNSWLFEVEGKCQETCWFEASGNFVRKNVCPKEVGTSDNW